MTFIEKLRRLAFCVFVLSGTIQAQELLEETVVVASKYPQKQSQIGRIVTVLGDSLIKSNSNLSLSSLLSQQVGIQVLGSGQTQGSVQSVFMRGAGAGYTLILLDGVPVYDPSNIEGNFDLNFISLHEIERIEILKGGQSTLYGSNAVAGVINIITKKGVSKGFEPSASYQFGSFNTVDGYLGGQGYLMQKVGYGISYNKSYGNGFSSASGMGFEPDGFNRDLFKIKVSSSIGPLNIKLKGEYSKYNSEIDAGGFVDDGDFTFDSRNLQVGASIDTDIKSGKITLNYLGSNIERSFKDDSTDIPVNAFNIFSFAKYGTASNFVDLYANYDVTKDLKLLLGADFSSQNTDQSYLSVSAFGPFEDVPINSNTAFMDNYSTYASINYFDQKSIGAEIGYRANRHNTYGWNSSFSISSFYQINKEFKVLGVWSSSFKNPSLYQLFSPYGNLSLSPEQSRNLDIGLEWRGSSMADFIQLNYFNRKIDNGILFIGTDVSPFGIYQNQSDQRDQGVELAINKRIGKISLSSNYTFLAGFLYNSAQAEQNKTFNLLRRPQHAVNATLGYAFNSKLNVSTNLKFCSVRKDRFYNASTFMSEEVELSSYFLVNLQANYDVTKDLKAFVSLRNLANTKYQEVYGFNSEPFNFRVGLTFAK